MSEFRKVFLVQLPNGEINLIPLEKIADLPIISRDSVDGFQGYWVHKKEIPGGASDGLGPEIIVDDWKEEHLKIIMANKGICFVQVDYQNKLKTPSNGFGHRKVEIFLEAPIETAVI